MRYSDDILDPAGNVFHGFDYDLQVWVESGIILACGHPLSMRQQGAKSCCPQNSLQGLTIVQARERTKCTAS